MMTLNSGMVKNLFFFTLVFTHIFILTEGILYTSYQFLNIVGGILIQNHLPPYLRCTSV